MGNTEQAILSPENSVAREFSTLNRDLLRCLLFLTVQMYSCQPEEARYQPDHLRYGPQMEYRRDIDKPIWHYCDRCPLWPEETFNIINSEKLPPDFELCEICSELLQQRPTEFRNHPILVCDGIMTWPPNWALTYGPGPRRFISGEIGVLEAVFLSKVVTNKVYLLTHMQEGNTYIGILPFEKAGFAKAVFDFLYGQRTKPLTAIGSLIFPENPLSEY